MCDGIADELLGIDLGDIRLNKRSKQVIEALAYQRELRRLERHACRLSVFRQ
jgi:hypothetical protein